MSSAGTLSYPSYTASQSTISLENAKSATLTDDGATVLMQLNLDATAQPQTDTITINATLPTSDTYYNVTIDDYTANPAVTATYFYDNASADTAETIATRLAALINALNPNVSAKVKADPNDNQIEVTSILPGTNGAFTSTVAALDAASNAAASGTPISKTSVAGSGTGKLRSVVQFTVELVPTTATANSPAYPELQLTGTWYNGANPAVAQSTISQTRFTGPLPLDALRQVA